MNPYNLRKIMIITSQLIYLCHINLYTLICDSIIIIIDIIKVETLYYTIGI